MPAPLLGRFLYQEFFSDGCQKKLIQRLIQKQIGPIFSFLFVVRQGELRRRGS